LFVGWQDEKTFIDPRFQALRVVKQTDVRLHHQGGITAGR
jgi:hypothetical protein